MNAKKMSDAYETGSRWDAMPPIERHQTIKMAMSNAMLMKGQGRMDLGTMDTIVANIDGFILSEYPGLRDKEMDYLLNLGISGELDKESYVSGANVMRWVRAYYLNPERLALVDAEDKAQREAEALSPMAIAQRNADAFEDAYKRALEYYRLHGTIFGEDRNEKGDVICRGLQLPQWAAQVYNHFHALGRIGEPTQQQIEQAKKEAADRVLEDRVVMALGQECIKITMQDWRDVILFEQHFAGLCSR